MSDSGSPPLVPIVHRKVVNYFGPQLISCFLNVIFTGAIIIMSSQFWSHARKERRIVQFMAAFVTIVALLHTFLKMYDTWNIFVTNYGNMLGSFHVSWSQKLQSTINLMMTMPVQAFLIWRCWKLMYRKWYILAPLVVLYIGTIITGIRFTVAQFTFDFDGSARFGSRGGRVVIPIDPDLMLVLSFATALDVSITGILLWFLTHSTKSIMTSHIRKRLFRLQMVIWEAAVPPALCAITSLIIYPTTRNIGFWNFIPLNNLGLLYVISLFTTLNGFRYRSEEMSTSQSTAFGRSGNTKDIHIVAHPGANPESYLSRSNPHFPPPLYLRTMSRGMVPDSQSQTKGSLDVHSEPLDAVDENDERGEQRAVP